MVSRRLRCRLVMKMLVELLPKNWTVLGVCLISVPMITLWFVFLRVSAVLVGILVVLAHLRVSAVSSIELAPHCLLLDKFS